MGLQDSKKVFSQMGFSKNKKAKVFSPNHRTPVGFFQNKKATVFPNRRLGFSQNKKGATLKEKGFFPTTRLGFSYKKQGKGLLRRPQEGHRKAKTRPQDFPQTTGRRRGKLEGGGIL